MRRRIAALACLAFLTQPIVASADESHWQWSSGATIGTEYVWRGQSLTDGKPSVNGEVKVSHDTGVYAGIWAGNADLGPQADTHAEIDYFVGWAKPFGKLSINTGYLYRQRPSATQSLDFQEITASASYNFGRARLGAGVFDSWDYFQGGRSVYTYTNLNVPIAKPHGVQILAIATAGHYDFSNRSIGNYNNGELRVIAIHNRWQYSAGYSDTNVDPIRSGLLTRNECGARWRAQVLVMF
jgi:uncharacterized protein (TIGR02001 family)